MEKDSRLKPHQPTQVNQRLMRELAETGTKMYHRRPITPVEARRIGQMSITDGVPIIRENVE